MCLQSFFIILSNCTSILTFQSCTARLGLLSRRFLLLTYENKQPLKSTLRVQQNALNSSLYNCIGCLVINMCCANILYHSEARRISRENTLIFF